MNGEHKAGEGVAFRPLLRESDFRAALGGMSERKFKSLLAIGIVPPPLSLGERSARWCYEDVLETIARLPRRERRPEPETLSAGRRARIARLKAGASK